MDELERSTHEFIRRLAAQDVAAAAKRVMAILDKLSPQNRVDWSKAPAGTEAYCNGYWLKRDDCEVGFLCQPVNNCWVVPNFKPWKQDGFIYKKDDVQDDQKTYVWNSCNIKPVKYDLAEWRQTDYTIE